MSQRKAVTLKKTAAYRRGDRGTKSGTLLKSQIPIRTWAEWDENQPGFLEIDLVGHEGGNSSGEFCFTLTATDIATGWTVNRSVRKRLSRKFGQRDRVWSCGHGCGESAEEVP